MGRPKALLPWQSSTFLGTVCARLENLPWSARIVVTRPELAAPIRGLLPAGWEIALNSEPERGMLSSLQTAVARVPAGSPWLMVTLVDQPGISEETFRRMALVAGREPWASAAHGGRNGHPVVIRRDCFEALLQAAPAGNPRDILRTFSRGSYECDDPHVLIDFDTPEELNDART